MINILHYSPGIIKTNDVIAQGYTPEQYEQVIIANMFVTDQGKFFVAKPFRGREKAGLEGNEKGLDRSFSVKL